MNEWLNVMLGEIDRRRDEDREAAEEAARRAAEQQARDAAEAEDS
jgi:hypothetical protein